MKTSAVILSGILLGTLVKVGSAAEGTPVLLELFTSEGCSSCPPADKLLQKLDHDRSLAGADVVVLSEHVDYWNHDGWIDPYSSPEFSKRQRDYASVLNSDVYTPQLVIDGSREVVGSDRAAIDRAIHGSVGMPKIPVIVSAKKNTNELEVHVEVGANAGKKPAAIYLVLAADQARSHVMHGENAGRDLEHVAVVKSLAKIGEVTSGSEYRKDLRSALPSFAMAGNLRVVVFVQEGASKRIFGVGQVRL